MLNQRIVRSLLLSSILGLMLAGCSSNTDSTKQTETKLQNSSAASLETKSSNQSTEKAATLYIGAPDKLKEVAVQNATTADELIAALAKETGWNLTLSQSPSDRKLQNTQKLSLPLKAPSIMLRQNSRRIAIMYLTAKIMS